LSTDIETVPTGDLTETDQVGVLHCEHED